MHFKALNIIQCACLHPQIFVDGKQSAQPRNKYTEHQHGTRHQHHHLGRNHLDQLRFVGHQPIGGSPQNAVGYESEQAAEAALEETQAAKGGISETEENRQLIASIVEQAHETLKE